VVVQRTTKPITQNDGLRGMTAAAATYNSAMAAVNRAISGASFRFSAMI
jgi:hypothetical protein